MLSIKANKEEFFHAITTKKNLVKFYKERAPHYKKPFEEDNRILKTSFKEDDISIIFEMRSKKETPEKKENSFSSGESLEDLFLKTLFLQKLFFEALINDDNDSKNDTQKN